MVNFAGLYFALHYLHRLFNVRFHFGYCFCKSPCLFLVKIFLRHECRENSKKSVFPTSFGGGSFPGNLFSFENKSDLQRYYLTSLVIKTSFYGVFLVAAVK